MGGNLSRGEIGEEKQTIKNLIFLVFVHSTHKRLRTYVGLDGNVWSRHGQTAWTAV